MHARPTLCFKTRGLLLLVGPPRLPPVEPAAAPATPRRASAGGRAALGEGGGGRQHQGVGHVDAEAVVQFRTLSSKFSTELYKTTYILVMFRESPS